ncbi:MAG TPA: YraN family protein [Candidatus Ratteibacteria bacterium]|jgi:putative endonuclease|uniref:UPF0102 protein BWX89_00510 n=1 Tax=candidate division TA06 bacterium ADurb.Bin131 TaxID=1852827 RepID=A0A1V6CC77_UNCT6|nr:MAG: hypothetical protein BWX89_00510 [candidate division TA06 bacterium ADurb.Bin131]HOC03486.1 YraN family protein [bacterium]HRS06537.1 YraN family protein [Candidatus Ratteibacteria bacterium]HON05237.1 YraN family protein [bacterium]HOQ82188.1 YraN family protein [bacterium]
MENKREKGFAGEEIAARFLRKNGYKILERNFATKSGEIDIIANKKRTIVFVEVKTRNTDNFGSPAEAVDSKKLTRLGTVANYYIQKKRLEKFPYRFEIVSITKQNNTYHCEIIPVD